MHVVGVAGRRNSGKTTLVEGLLGVIPEETSVATVKSIHHDVEFDTTGTDTHRHQQAGADTVIGLAPSKTATFRATGKADGVELTDQLETLAEEGTDWVLVEGFKSVPIPTIIVGDLESEAVAGRMLFRIQDGTRADPEAVWDRLDSVPHWESDGS